MSCFSHFKIGVISVLFLSSTSFGRPGWAETGETRLLSENVSSEVIRGNFAALEISPFKWRVVGSGYGVWGDYTGDEGVNRYTSLFKTTIFGGTLGGDWLLTDNCLAGLHIESGHIGIDSKRGECEETITSVGGVGRISFFGSRWYWDASLGIAGDRNNASFFADETDYSTGKTITQTNYQTEFGLKLNSGFTKVEPFAGLRYITLGSSGIDLAGVSDPTAKSSVTEPSSVRTMIGSRFAWEFSTFLATVRPTLSGMWVHEFDDNRLLIADDRLLFPIAGEFGDRKFSQNRAVLGSGVSIALRDMVDLFADYSCSWGSDETTYSVSGGFHIKY